MNTKRKMRAMMSTINDKIGEETTSGDWARTGVLNVEALKGQALVNELAAIFFEMEDRITKLEEEIEGLKKERA